MMQEYDAEVRTGRLLFGSNTPIWRIEVNALLNQDKIPYQQLFEICLGKVYDKLDYRAGELYRKIGYQAVAEIIVAVMAGRPNKSEQWLRILFPPILYDDAIYQAPIDFFMGLALGLFEAGTWLDQNWKSKTVFEERLPEAIIRLITRKEPVAVDFVDDLLPCYNWDKILPQYESRLAKAIKAYFRPGGDTGREGARLAQALLIMEDVVDKQEVADKKYKLSKLGEMMLKQICFAVSGPMNPLAHAEVLSTYLCDFLFSPVKTQSAEAEE